MRAAQLSRGRARSAPLEELRLGVYVDTVYRRGTDRRGQGFTNFELFPFLQFVAEVGVHFGELVLYGRRDPGGTGADHELPGAVTLVELPYYENLARGLQVLRAAPGTVAAMWRGAGRADVIWVFGPYPFSLVLVAFGLMRGRRVVLGVRQDTMSYFRSRLPHRLASPVLLPLWAIDRLYRVLSRVLPTVVVGSHLERQYGGPRRGLLPLRISLVRAGDVLERPPEKDLSDHVDLLTVGRVEPEKNPFLLVDALAELQRRARGRYRLTWVGQGRLLEQTQARARALGLADAIDFAGYVPFGGALLERYRSADVFVHVALTEAFGQVLTEAMACGLPIVATRVGGVPSAVEEGAAGVLVPPGDLGSLADAIERVSGDGALRRELVERGLGLAREHTLEAEALRVAALARGA